MVAQLSHCSAIRCWNLEAATAAHDWSGQILRCIRRSLSISDTHSAYVSQACLPTAQNTAASLFQGPTKDVHLFPRPTTMTKIKADSHCQYATLILFCEKRKREKNPRQSPFCSGMTSDGLSNSAGSCAVPTEEHQHSSSGLRQCSSRMESSGGQPAQSGHRRREAPPEGRATAAQRSTPAGQLRLVHRTPTSSSFGHLCAAGGTREPSANQSRHQSTVK
ncbi:hypothetical protein BDP81DRAFT_189667 [Colletotrichum phormii]|uniref:Uncharacterized protein n=1 Tax=Colletotrichum phormii TaxID=359342 RepID=A0AAJ0EJ82_9PEZI|nr:uncharacterized protein BDP81DRAFT_189667 [Colletotrichum phormii]KAK1638665.1 hypothetical protein BDP81DRAFT_189667 [Colletotrichum phormii]